MEYLRATVIVMKIAWVICFVEQIIVLTYFQILLTAATNPFQVRSPQSCSKAFFKLKAISRFCWFFLCFLFFPDYLLLQSPYLLEWVRKVQPNPSILGNRCMRSLILRAVTSSGVPSFSEFWKPETSKDIRKIYWYHLSSFKTCAYFINSEDVDQKLKLPRPF